VEIRNVVTANRYCDSILLMSLANRLREVEGVHQASAVMGTPANQEILEESGMLSDDGRAAGPNDLILALLVDDDSAAVRAREHLDRWLTESHDQPGDEDAPPSRTLEAALAVQPDTNLVFISVPGEFAAREARKALEAGRHVMLFSDNVPLEDEVSLKRLAEEKGLLVMGPDCGTAIINGTALGFANRIRSGSVGIVGAAGTGIQEVSVLVHRAGIGISHAIGTGGRDLHFEVGGRSMLQGLRMLESDPRTDLILLISKPPNPEVAARIVGRAARCQKAVILNFLGLDAEEIDGIPNARSLEEAAARAAAHVKRHPYRHSPFESKKDHILSLARPLWEALAPGQEYLRGLYSGGTLCYEGQLVLTRLLGPIWSNAPLDKEMRIKDSRVSRQHTTIDLGEDEFTRGVPHPMIDNTVRIRRLQEEARDPSVGVILLDLVLGYGAHPDPASELGPVIREVREAAQADGHPLAVVVSICGSDMDPQEEPLQRRQLEEAGAVVFNAHAQAARFAALVITRGEAAGSIWSAGDRP